MDGHFYVRQLWDVKIKPHIEVFNVPMMVKYAQWCGWILARVHAKSGDATMINGYLGNSSKFDKAIASFAVTYAAKNERDYQAFSKQYVPAKLKFITDNDCVIL
jgi:hypothetical protein